MIRSQLKMRGCIVASIMIVLFVAFSAFANSVQADEDIVIVARNYLSIDAMSGTGVVIGSKKGLFEPEEFKGIKGTAVLMFMYNRISRDKCVSLLTNLYGKDQAQVAPMVDHVLAFLKDKDLLLKSKYPNPSVNYGMNKFREE
ncbi:MAG: hypothetical protein AB7D27_11390 [Desulfomicrobium sp.]